jgi:ubiquinone/menaquinone biosynthesis C-methylase UbiE
MAAEKKISQFQSPRGAAGRIAGWVMAWWNTEINAMTLELLEVNARDHVLEIGFGPGTLLAALAASATDGFVAGVDPSATMIAMARRRNRKVIASGRVELKSGEISRIPYPDARFSRVCTVNTIYFWREPAACMREVARVLREGGRFAVTFRVQENPPRSVSARMGLPAYDVGEVERLVKEAGFKNVAVQVREVRRMTAACVVGLR